MKTRTVGMLIATLTMADACHGQWQPDIGPLGFCDWQGEVILSQARRCLYQVTVTSLFLGPKGYVIRDCRATGFSVDDRTLLSVLHAYPFDPYWRRLLPEHKPIAPLRTTVSFNDGYRQVTLLPHDILLTAELDLAIIRFRKSVFVRSLRFASDIEPHESAAIIGKEWSYTAPRIILGRVAEVGETCQFLPTKPYTLTEVQGFSGSPVLNLQGEALGMVTRGPSDSEGLLGFTSGLEIQRYLRGLARSTSHPTSHPTAARLTPGGFDYLVILLS